MSPQPATQHTAAAALHGNSWGGAPDSCQTPADLAVEREQGPQVARGRRTSAAKEGWERSGKGALPVRPAAPPKGPEGAEFTSSQMMCGQLSPGPVGISRGPAEQGDGGSGGGTQAPLGAGHGAMALTVYSACFFPYHFIHFLNSRSMVCKG